MNALTTPFTTRRFKLSTDLNQNSTETETAASFSPNERTARNVAHNLLIMQNEKLYDLNFFPERQSFEINQIPNHFALLRFTTIKKVVLFSQTQTLTKNPESVTSSLSREDHLGSKPILFSRRLDFQTVGGEMSRIFRFGRFKWHYESVSIHFPVDFSKNINVTEKNEENFLFQMHS